MTVDDNSSANVFHSHNSNHNNHNNNIENGDQVGKNGDDDDNIVVVVEEEQAGPGVNGDADHYHGNGHPHHPQNHNGLSTTTTSTTTPTVNPILSCSSSSSKSAVPSPFPYTRIHAHCGQCIRPLRCIRKPAFAAGATSASQGLSTEELYAMILSVNFYSSGGLLPTETDQLDSCPVVRCPNDVCPVLLHYCKLPEHFLLCHYQKIPCLNATYGCPYTMQRREVPAHLKRHCPANVVHCSAEWNRLPLHCTELKSPQTRAVFCPPQALDIRNLDVALALRDQRMLKQLWSASRQMKRIMRGCLSTHPAVPIKPYIGVRTYREYGPNEKGGGGGGGGGGGNGSSSALGSSSDPNSSPGGDREDGEDEEGNEEEEGDGAVHHDEELYFAFAARLVDAAYQDGLVEMLKRSASVVQRSYEQQRLVVSADAARTAYHGRQKSNSICQMGGSGSGSSSLMVQTSSAASSALPPPLSPSSYSSPPSMVSMPSSSSINLPIISDSIVRQSAEIAAAAAENTAQTEASSNSSVQQQQQPQQSQLPPMPPPVPRCNALSLEVSIRSLAAYQPKPRSMYTFRCGGDYRRDEVAAHHRDIHSDIHGGLDGWIEHRCPLFQYGCPFVHRRWAPTSAATGERLTLVYNECLEAFACGSPAENDGEGEEEGDNVSMVSASLNCSVTSLKTSPKKERRSVSFQMDQLSVVGGGGGGTCSRRGSSASSASSTSGNVCNTFSCSCSSSNSSSFTCSKKYCSTMSLLSPSTSSSSSSSPFSSSSTPLAVSPTSPTITSAYSKFTPSFGLELPLHEEEDVEEIEDVEVEEEEEVDAVFGLNDFPFEILQHICTYLDGYSLNSLSFACSRLRLVVQSFLKKKGYVQLQWKRYEVAKGQYRWKVAYKKWMFSTAIAPLGGWSLDADNVVGEHLRVCPFNDRQSHGTAPLQVIFLNADATVMMKRQRP